MIESNIERKDIESNIERKDGYTRTGLTSPFQRQWTAKNPITAGTMYNSAGCNKKNKSGSQPIRDLEVRKG